MNEDLMLRKDYRCRQKARNEPQGEVEGNG